MTIAASPWPPLIVAEKIPPLIRWRDFLLTVLMWMIFAALLETEFELFFGVYLEAFGLGDFDTEGNWAIFFEHLTPYLMTAGVLICLLVAAGILTVRRRRRALLLPPPPPLGLAEECRQAGLDQAVLVAARAARIVVVHTGKQGQVNVELRLN